MGNTIISFEDFSKKSKKASIAEDTIMPTGNSTVFVEEPDGEDEGHHSDQKNYMFFKNLYTMKKCIDEIMAMDKDQVDELIERGHDWASDHITSSKDDIQEVCDWLRYEIETHEEDYEEEEEENDDDDDDDDDDETPNVSVDIEGNNDEVEVEDGEEEEEEEEDEEKETSESNFSYEEEKN